MARLLLLLLLLPGLALADQPEYGPDGLPLASIARLLPGNGDLFGHRRWLAERGVTYNLWYRTDLLASAGVQPPKTFDDFLKVSQAVNKGDVSAFGMRGGAGGHDHWGSFVLGGGANFDKGGMVTAKALAANRWFVELGTKHKVFPASAPTD